MRTPPTGGGPLFSDMAVKLAPNCLAAMSAVRAFFGIGAPLSKKIQIKKCEDGTIYDLQIVDWHLRIDGDWSQIRSWWLVTGNQTSVYVAIQFVIDLVVSCNIQDIEF